MNAAPHARDLVPGPVRASTLERVIWQLWVWLAWLVPLCALGLRFLTPLAGWETLMLAVSAPVWLPLLAVLIMVPRWIWRSRSGRSGLSGLSGRSGLSERDGTPPALVTAAGVAHWGGLFLLAFAMRGIGDTRTHPSVLLDTLPALGERGEALVLAVATVLSGVALLTAIAAATFTRVDRARGPHGWLPVTVALLLPGLLVAGALFAQR